MLLQPRWAMSMMRGPVTRAEIRRGLELERGGDDGFASRSKSAHVGPRRPPSVATRGRRKPCAAAADEGDPRPGDHARAAPALARLPHAKESRGWFFMVMRGALSDQRCSSRRFIAGLTPGSRRCRLRSTTRTTRARITSTGGRAAMESLNDTLLTVRLRLQQHTLREIDELLRIPTSSVSTRLMRARKLMRAALAEEQESEL
jgi:hypothetical protein